MSVEEHNKETAAVWSAGGSAYDDISFNISDALLHGAERLWPSAGDRVLDIATGTGWTARNVARFGAEVTAVDIAEDLLEGAKTLSASTQPPIDFRIADAEALPFDDAAFDKVISTFGVMFAPNQEKAAAEMTRVCRPGGRLVLITWTKGGYIEDFFGVLAPYSDAPAPSSSPLDWGDTDHVKSLLGAGFNLVFERGITTGYFPDSEAIWKKYMAGFGPVRLLAQSLAPDEADKLKSDFVAFHDKFKTEAGISIPRDYLVTIGTRRA